MLFVGWGLRLCALRGRGCGSVSVSSYPIHPVGDGVLLAPPSSVLRLNPSVSIPKEGDNHRSPFQATNPMRSSDASQAVVCVEESTRLGSVFFGFVARLPTWRFECSRWLLVCNNLG